MQPLAQWRGIDRRQPREGIGDNRRLWTADNVYITPGRSIRRRPPQRYAFPCSRDIIGLAWISGKLHAWYGTATVPSPTPPAASVTLHAVRQPGRTLSGLVLASAMQGRVFSAVQYDGNYTRYYWNNASGVPVEVTDGNCPHTPQVAVASSRIFAAAGDVVRFSKAADPSDWTAQDDAGFLPTGRQAGGQTDIQALVGWRGKLLVFYIDQVQVWTVGLDPTTDHSLDDVLEGFGTEHQGSVVGIGDEVVFRAPEGYRSVMTNPFGRPLAREIGEQIDRLVQNPDRILGGEQRAVYTQALEQYINVRGGRAADVMTYSRESELHAWSTYSFASPVDYPVAAGARLYMRNLDTGAIVVVDTEAPETDDFRDQTGPPSVVSRQLTSQARLEVAFPQREGATPTVVDNAPFVTPRTNGGPSPTNQSPFVAWPVPAAMTPVTLNLASDLSSPRGVLTDSVEVVLDYCAQGVFPQGAGAVLEGNRSITGGQWTRLATFAGWEYDPNRRVGDIVRDADDVEFYVIADGGWRRGRAVAPPGYRRLRLRILDASTGTAGELVASWLTRLAGEDLAFNYVSSRAVVPERQPTALSPAIVFVAAATGPRIYVPGPGDDVATKTTGMPQMQFQTTHSHQLGAVGSYTSASGSVSITDLSAVRVLDELTYTVGTDGFIPAGDLNFAPAQGSRWWETYVPSLSAYIDRQRAELLVVSGNGREWRSNGSRGRIRVDRYALSNGERRTPGMVFEVPVRDRYDADVGAFYLTADTALNRWYLVGEGRSEVHVFTRGTANTGTQAYLSSIGLPVTDVPTMGIAADVSGNLYWATYPARVLYRYNVMRGAWLLMVEDMSAALQSRSLIHEVGGKLYAYDTFGRRLRVWQPLSLPGQGAVMASADFCIRDITASAGASVSTRCLVDMPFVSAGGRVAREADWLGVRLDQRGGCRLRVAARGPGGRTRTVPPNGRYLSIDGDTSADDMTSLGVSSPEIAPEIVVDHDNGWELSSMWFEVNPLSQWA